MVADGAGQPLQCESRDRLLPVVLLVVSVGTPASVVYHYALGMYLHLGYPHNTFLFLPSDRFMDFVNDRAYALDYGTWSLGHTIVYTPMAHVVARDLAGFPVAIAYAGVLAAFLGTFWFLVARYFCVGVNDCMQRVLACALLTLLSYPILFAVDRGNMDLLIFVLLVWFVHFYYAGRMWAAVALISLAVAMKLYPAPLLLLFFCDRRWSRGAAAVGLTAVLSLAGAVMLAVSARQTLLTVLSDTRETLLGGHLAYSWTGLAPVQHGHSIWGFIHALWWFGSGSDPPSSATRGYAAVAVMILVISGSVLLVRSRSSGRDLEPWRKLTVLVSLTLLLPWVSHDYSLLLVFVPLGLLVASERRHGVALAVALLLAFTLIPLDYVVLVDDVTISVFAYPALLMASGVLALVSGGVRTPGVSPEHWARLGGSLVP